MDSNYFPIDHNALTTSAEPRKNYTPYLPYKRVDQNTVCSWWRGMFYYGTVEPETVLGYLHGAIMFCSEDVTEDLDLLKSVIEYRAFGQYGLRYEQ